ncbi:MAG: putative 2OG-Fe(II) oxygenase [Lysobacterales bacterium]
MSQSDISDPAIVHALLDRDPKQPKVWLTLARMQARQGLPGEAERSFRQALKQDDSFDTARLELAQLLVRNGHPGPGIVQVQRLLEQNPSNAEAWLVAGEAFRENVQPAEAAMAFARACEIAPSHEGAAFARVGHLLDQGEAEQAQELTKGYLRARSRTSEQWWHLHVRTQHVLNGPVAAETELDKALAVHPESAMLHALLAKVRHQLGHPSWAGRLIKAAQRENARDAMILTAAAALRGGSRANEAQSLVENRLKRFNNSLIHDAEQSLWLELADCHLSQGDFPQALKAAKNAQCCQQGASALPTRQLIDALLSAGHFDEALPLIRQMRQLLPLENRWLAAEATVLRALGDPAGDALFDIQRLVWIKDMPVQMWQAIQPGLMDELHQAHKGAGFLLDQSLRGGTQTSTSLLRSTAPATCQLLDYLLAAVGEYRAQIDRRDDHPLDQRLGGEPLLVGCWSVKLASGGFHVSHLHSQGTVSSAFYVSLPPGIDDAKPSFKAQPGWLALGAPRFPVPGVDATHWVQPRPGRLVLFPSWFWHGTVPFAGEEPRLSVAFDAIFR